MKDNKYLTLREFKDIKERFQDCIVRQEKLLASCLTYLDLIQVKDPFLYYGIRDLRQAIRDELKRDFL